MRLMTMILEWSAQHAEKEVGGWFCNTGKVSTTSHENDQVCKDRQSQLVYRFTDLLHQACWQGPETPATVV